LPPALFFQQPFDFREAEAERITGDVDERLRFAARAVGVAKLAEDVQVQPPLIRASISTSAFESLARRLEAMAEAKRPPWWRWLRFAD
jgi:hypothetical protein